MHKKNPWTQRHGLFDQKRISLEFMELLDCCLGNQEIVHRDKMTDTATHYEQVKDFMRAKISMRQIELLTL